MTQTSIPEKAVSYTPGPWDVQVRQPIDGDAFFDIYQTDGHGNESAVACIGADAETAANACLIAAAPDLLAALKEAVKYTHTTQWLHTACDAAIARAEGR